MTRPLELSNYKAVIFDMDGVLIDSEPLWKIAMENAFQQVGINLERKQFAQTVGLRIDEVIRYWRARFPWTDYSNEEVEEFIISGLEQLITENGAPLVGVIDTLDFLKAKGLKIGLATSSYNRLIHYNLNHLQIGHYFDFTHSAEDESHGKPHPAVYLTCAQKLSVSPLECLVIEDSFSGILAGKAARMDVIAIPENTHEPDSRLIIADYQFDDMQLFLNTLNS
jgi:mannitol-1-/sugar-/sorbitol-6-/2-deoxyglucose-6-phosphatase